MLETQQDIQNALAVLDFSLSLDHSQIPAFVVLAFNQNKIKLCAYLNECWGLDYGPQDTVN